MPIKRLLHFISCFLLHLLHKLAVHFHFHNPSSNSFPCEVISDKVRQGEDTGAYQGLEGKVSDNGRDVEAGEVNDMLKL